MFQIDLQKQLLLEELEKQRKNKGKVNRIQKLSLRISQLQILVSNLQISNVVGELEEEDLFQIDNCEKELKNVNNMLEHIISGILEADPIAMIKANGNE